MRYDAGMAPEQGRPVNFTRAWIAAGTGVLALVWSAALAVESGTVPDPTALPTETRPTPRGFRWQALPGETPAGLAATLFPKNPTLQRKLLQGMRRANPDLALEDPALPLPPGTPFRLPDLRDAYREVLPIEAPAPRPRGTPPAASGLRERFVAVAPAPLARLFSAGEGLMLKLSAGELDLSFARRATEEQRLGYRQIRQRLTAEDQNGAILDLQSRIARLETLVDSVRQSIARLPAAPPLPATAPPWRDGLLLGTGGLAALILAAAALWLRRRHRQAALWDAELFPAALPPAATTAAPDFSLEPDNAPDHGPAAGPASALPSAKPPATEQDIDLEELLNPTRSIIGDVDRYIALGRPQSAISLLKSQIEKDPQDRLAWAKLLLLYRTQGGMRRSFDNTAEQFAVRFPDPASRNLLQKLMRFGEDDAQPKDAELARTVILSREQAEASRSETDAPR